MGDSLLRARAGLRLSGSQHATTVPTHQLRTPVNQYYMPTAGIRYRPRGLDRPVCNPLSDDAPPPDCPGRGGTREERPLLWSGPAHVRLRCDERRLAAPRLGQAAARRRRGQRVRRRAARVRRANLLADRLETRARPRLPGPSMHFCRGRVHGDARLRCVPGYGPVPCTLRERDRRGSPGLRAGGRAVLRHQRGVPRKNKSDALGPRVAMDRRVSGVLRVAIWLWAAV
mmetsp:Transcript_8083/g.22672  ORF Transcript_8083/g.22672 Transcript_8083/m.22672 type:complete len:228 (+) Transcript_8083:1844-2527(+)